MGTNDSNSLQVDALLSSLTSQDIPPGPSERLMKSTTEAMHAVARVPTYDVSNAALRKSNGNMIQYSGSRMIGPRILGSSVAVAVIGCFIAGVLFFNVESQRSFAEVIENVRKAELTRYVYSTSRDKTGNTGYFVCSVSGSALRVERYSAGTQHVMTSIIDLEKKAMLHLNVSGERAFLNPMMKELSANYGNPLCIMAGIAKEEVSLVDTIWNQGKAIDVYTLSRVHPCDMGITTPHAPSDEDSFKVWVDRETQLPRRMLFHYAHGLQIEMKDFQWDLDPEPGMFDMTIPNGFEVCKDFRDLYRPAVRDKNHTHSPHRQGDEMHPHNHGVQHKAEPASE